MKPTLLVLAAGMGSRYGGLKQMEIYRQQIEDMDESIEDLKTDRDSLEKFARERFHFAAPGEDVYLIEE